MKMKIWSGQMYTNKSVLRKNYPVITRDPVNLDFKYRHEYHCTGEKPAMTLLTVRCFWLQKRLLASELLVFLMQDWG